jgi:peroxiredoxin
MTQPVPARRAKTQIDPRWIIVGAILAILLALVMIFTTRDKSGETPTVVENPGIPVNRAAIDFNLIGLDGSPIALADFRGKYVLVNFWATWCPPCQREMPDLQAFYRKYQNRNFVLLAIDVEEEAATVADFIQTNNFDFPVALDADGMVSIQYGAEALPSSFLIGPDGTLIKRWQPGALTPEVMDRDITPLLPF